MMQANYTSDGMQYSGIPFILGALNLEVLMMNSIPKFISVVDKIIELNHVDLSIFVSIGMAEPTGSSVTTGKCPQFVEGLPELFPAEMIVVILVMFQEKTL